MPSSQLWLLLVVLGLASGVPFQKDNLVKREIESVHFGNHQNKVAANEGMADAQLLASYLGPEKRAQILKENVKKTEEHDDEETDEKKKRVAPEEVDESDWGSQYPTYYNYYNNLLSDYKPSPIISPEDNLPYVPAFRRRRASPIASAKLHHKKKSLLSSVSKFLRRRRSAGYDMVDPVTLAEIFKAAATEKALEELEEDMEDNDYYDRYEFKYPYYPGMVEYMSQQAEEDEEPEQEQIQDPYEMLYTLLYSSPSSSEEEHPHWYDMSPAQPMQVQRRSETLKKRYSFPYIAMPGQKKKRDQIDTPYWGKIEDKRTEALRKRPEQPDELYALAQLLNEVKSPEDNLVYRRAVL